MSLVVIDLEKRLCVVLQIYSSQYTLLSFSFLIFEIDIIDIYTVFIPPFPANSSKPVFEGTRQNKKTLKAQQIRRSRDVKLALEFYSKGELR